MKKNDNIDSFKYYISKSKLSILIILFTLLLAFGMRLINTGVSIDTELYISSFWEPNRWAWILSLNRYGLVLLNTIFQINGLPIFIQNFMTFVFILLYSIMFSYLFYKYIPEKYKESYLKYQFVFPILYITNPLFVEQYNFVLQNISVSFSILMIPTSILIIDYAKKYDKLIIKIALYLSAIIINTIIFGVYQSIILLYILTVCSIYLLKIIKENDNNIAWLLKHIAIFGVSAFNYVLLGKILSNGGNAYLRSAWGNENLHQIIINIKNCIVSILRCETIFYDALYIIALLIIFIYVIYLFFKNRKNIIAKLVALFGIVTGPFYIMILTGLEQLKRTQFNYPYVAAFVLVLFITYLAYKKKKILLIISLIIVSVYAYKNAYYSSSLFHTAYEIYLEDRSFADTLNKDIISQNWYDSEKEYKLIFVGRKTTNINQRNISMRSEVIGSSFFDFDYLYLKGLNQRANAFMKDIGYYYQEPSDEEFQMAKEYVKNNKVNNYPKKNSIIKYDDTTIIVKLSEE